jgi:hypothetical protein
MRQIGGSILAWIVGSLVTASAVLAVGGARAAIEMLPIIVMGIGFWIFVVAIPLGALVQRFRPLVAVDIYLFAFVSATLSFGLFYVLFIYALMFSLPVAAFAAALTFNRFAVRRVSGRGDR